MLPAYNNIAYMEGTATLNGEGVLVGDTAIRAPKIIITTGSSAAIPPIRGLDDVALEHRVVMLKETPEALDLFAFAVSEPYFSLRRNLGLALRSAG